MWLFLQILIHDFKNLNKTSNIVAFLKFRGRTNTCSQMRQRGKGRIGEVMCIILKGTDYLGLKVRLPLGVSSWARVPPSFYVCTMGYEE